ncbi:periplasmic solute binding protein [Clostridium cellulovorans 743B]|uniref:Periplasmic solute binding protein n=1 Tax=Clostridium cellulovorans (strain ATCC 35296 / DSM 3052 / OCM 3 / 743B) TaxID=573061 RepID=D9STI3_CLOC7|nr:periplasmic solute binding protein [Clostridium cellulovorans 743B]
MKRILALAIALVICTCLYGCKRNTVEVETGITYEDKQPVLDIMTTNNISKNLVRYITKDRHDIESIFYDDVPHTDFKYTEDTISNISSKDLFFYLGSAYEPWSDSLIPKIELKNLGCINISRGIKLQSYNDTLTVQGTTYSDNPYFYYSLSNLRTILFNIKISIEEKDPKNRSFYEDNFNDSMKAIDALADDINKNSSKLKNITVVLSTDQMEYYFKELGLNILKVPYENISESDVNKINESLNKNKKDGKVIIWIYSEENEHKIYDEIIRNNNIGMLKLQIGEDNIIESMKESFSKITGFSDKAS